MRIAFVTSHYESLAIEQLSAIARQAGHQTELFFEPALFHNFFYDSPLLYRRIFSHEDAIVDGVAASRPDLVAFSVISDNYQWTLDLARTIKRRLDTTVVFGGIHPTSVPERVLREEVADFVVVGEGEGAFLELLDSLERGRDPSGIANLGGRWDGRSFLNPPRPPIEDLDALPFPDKDLFFNEFAPLVRQAYMVMGSRGCPSSCSYCWNSTISRVYPRGFFRRRSPSNILEELVSARARYGIKRVTFYDEVFTADRGWLREFLQGYRERVALPYFCCVHPDNVDEETVELLEGSGCSSVNIGIQTASEETRREVLGRGGSNNGIARALALLGESRLFVYSNLMLGLPGETEEDLRQTLRFCARHKADLPAIYWLRYYPGTRIVDEAHRMGVLSEADVERILDSRDYQPYAISGSTYSRTAARLGNMILLSGVLPTGLTELLESSGLYRLMPAGNLLFPAIVAVGWGKRLLAGKRHPFHYLSVSDYLEYYGHYIRRRLADWTSGAARS